MFYRCFQFNGNQNKQSVLELLRRYPDVEVSFCVASFINPELFGLRYGDLKIKQKFKDLNLFLDFVVNLIKKTLNRSYY